MLDRDLSFYGECCIGCEIVNPINGWHSPGMSNTENEKKQGDGLGEQARVA